MEIIEINTLIDITKPEKVVRSGQGSLLEQNQYKNWITFQQCIGLRSIITYDFYPQLSTVDVKGMGFGSKIKGEHIMWTFRFYPDRSFAYEDNDNNRIGLLIQDLHQVPIIEKLTETINITKSVFDLEDPLYKNTTIKVSVNLL